MECEYIQTCELRLTQPEKCRTEYENCTLRPYLKMLEKWRKEDETMQQRKKKPSKLE